MAGKILRKFKKELTNPKNAYYFGNGTWAYKPKTIYLFLNNQCNARCIMCDIGIKNRDSSFYQHMIQDGTNTLSLAAVEKIVNEVKGFKPKININGVEPLLYKELLKLLELLKNNGLEVQIITNGILLEKYAADLVRLNIDNILVSIDGLEQVHDKIRGEGVYQKALAGIRALNRSRQETGKSKPKLTVNYTFLNFNYKHLRDFAELMLNTEGVDLIKFKHLFYVSEEMSQIHNSRFSNLGKATPSSIQVINPQEMPVEVLWEECQAIFNLKSPKISFYPNLQTKQEFNDYYYNPLKPVLKDKCFMPWKSMSVQPNGNVIIRSRCFDYNAGNVNQQSILEIWYGEQYRRFRIELKKNKGLFPVCTRCCGLY